jgi:hypothetical protein
MVAFRHINHSPVNRLGWTLTAGSGFYLTGRHHFRDCLRHHKRNHSRLLATASALPHAAKSKSAAPSSRLSCARSPDELLWTISAPGAARNVADELFGHFFAKSLG